MADTPTTAPAPAKRTNRSPNYPGISLDVALQRAQQMYAREGRHAASPEVICTHWGLSHKSSTGMINLAAVKRFGLLEPDGKGSNNLKLSQRALRILLDEDPASQSRRQAIQEAALAPDLHAELWKEWQGDLPSQANMRTKLQLDRGFTSPGADEFIKQYRATLTFAGFLGSSTLATSSPEPEADEGAELPPPTVTAAPTEVKVSPGFQGESAPRDLPLPLISGGTAVLKLPYALTEEDFDWLTTMLEKLKRGILRPAEPEQANDWRTRLERGDKTDPTQEP